jgi:hypothetical protein
MPAFFVDTMREKDCLYLLSWKEAESEKVLLVKNVYDG